MSPVMEFNNSARTQQFCQSFGDNGEHYVVRLEELMDHEFVIHFGVHPELTTYPTRGRRLLKLEAIQLLGRLWGDSDVYRMPEEVKVAYMVWLMDMEKQFLAGKPVKS